MRWYRLGKRSRWYPLAATVILCIIIMYNICKTPINDNVLQNKEQKINKPVEEIPDITRRFIETKLEEVLKEDKGTGCEFPHLDPFSTEVTQFEGPTKNINCSGHNWVRCYLSECRVVDEILASTRHIICIYRDIIYESDFKRSLGSPTMVLNDDVYTLRQSDHVKVKCKGRDYNLSSSSWVGVAIGFRTNVESKIPPPGREGSLDVLILGFDSTSKNRFIRKMPKSYEYLKHELGAVILDKYHIVGDNTAAALFPILSGKTEYELPDARRVTNNTLNITQFIFYKLKEDGYRTAYFENMPWIGTFQYRFNGFSGQPADHYIRPFLQEERIIRYSWNPNDYLCVGDTPNYKLMLNITEQLFKLDGKLFAFTFIGDITHDDLDTIGIADLDTRSFLRSLKDSGIMDHTLIMVMGDHGIRFGKIRYTLQGKFDHRMPLMAIRLPESLKQRRPDVEATLKNNSQVLTTPHDIYATLLDAMDLKQYYNDYKIKGAELTRGMSLFESIPASRSCSEAGIEAHWCICVAWDAVPSTEAIYSRAVKAFVHFINTLTDSVRFKCVPRTLISISWVNRRRRANNRRRSYNDYYQIKISVGPGYGIFEATTAYFNKEDTFVFDAKDISRTNAYNKEPSCISDSHPHLNYFCYCRGAGLN